MPGILNKHQRLARENGVHTHTCSSIRYNIQHKIYRLRPKLLLRLEQQWKEKKKKERRCCRHTYENGHCWNKTSFSDSNGIIGWCFEVGCDSATSVLCVHRPFQNGGTPSVGHIDPSMLNSQISSIAIDLISNSWKLPSLGKEQTRDGNSDLDERKR